MNPRLISKYKKKTKEEAAEDLVKFYKKRDMLEKNIIPISFEIDKVIRNIQNDSLGVEAEQAAVLLKKALVYIERAKHFLA